VFDQDPAEVLVIDEALKKLEEMAPRRAQVVTMRYFAGLTRDETAEAMGISPRLVDKEWRSARAWLHRELS
jgi:RNA polymerase sigma-70 factor (ECF subfamily)